MIVTDGPGPVSDTSGDTDVLARRTHALLLAHVPLTLLADLADPAGPDSSAVYAAEPADAAWLNR